MTKPIQLFWVALLLAGVAVMYLLFASRVVQSKNQRQAVKTIMVVSSNAYGYVPEVIRVKYGETVKLILTTKDDAHSFTVPGYNINQMILPGKQTELVFHAIKRGTFVFFCDVPCPMVRNQGMIIVS